MYHFALRLCLLAFIVLLPLETQAARLKPFSLASKSNGDLESVTMDIRNKLENNGFQIVGIYKPYKTTNIMIVTSQALKRHAATTRYGGFGAVLKVAVTQTSLSNNSDDEIQVTYNNPNYIGLAFNMKNKLDDVKAGLKKAIGFIRDYGGGEGIEEAELPDYNYTFGLEGFYGFFEFVDHGSYARAIRKVETGLATNHLGIRKVFRVDIPGKQQTVYGLDLQAKATEQPYLNDKFVMEVIDYQKLRRSAHLPYEIMVQGSKVISMHPHFRLAVNFPDLHMFGMHSFGRLMDLPYVYEEYFTQVVGGKWPPDEILDD